MKSIIKRGVVYVCIAALLMQTFSLSAVMKSVAVDNTVDEEWYLPMDLNVYHESLKLSGVDSSQPCKIKVYVQIGEDNFIYESELRMGYQIIDVPFAKGYPKGTKCQIYIEDSSGRKTRTVEGLVKECDLSFFEYYTKVRPSSAITSLISPISSVKVKIGDNEYASVLDKENQFVVNYPRQEPGELLHIEAACKYGCTASSKIAVTMDKLREKQIEIKKDRALIVQDYLDSDTWLCVQIGDSVYKSKSGVGSLSGTFTLVEFPMQPAGAVATYWTEDSLGNRSEKVHATIPECNLGLTLTEKTLTSILGEVTGFSGTNSEYAVATIGGIAYRAQVNYDRENNGTFTIKFPVQEKLTPVAVTVYDEHGCHSATKYTTTESWDFPLSSGQFSVYASNFIFYYDSSISPLVANVTAKIFWQIGDEVYSSEERDFNSYNYREHVRFKNRLKPNTLVTFWLMTDDGLYSNKVQVRVQQLNMVLKKATVKASGISGRLDYFLSDSMLQNFEREMPARMSYTTVTIGNKTYKGKGGTGFYSKSGLTGDTLLGAYLDFGAKFPRQKRGARINVKVEAETGYTMVKTYTIGNEPIPLKANTIEYGDTKITGTTAARAKLTFQIGKRIYSATASSSGRYSKSIPFQKAGNKIKVKSVDPYGHYTIKTFTVKKTWGYVDCTQILRNTRSVKVDAKRVFKGEKIKVFIKGKTYQKKITTNRSNYRVSINIGKHPVGSKVTIIHYDKYNKVRERYDTKIYYGAPYVGMPVSQLKHSTWGQPRHINYYSSLQQWVYRRFSTPSYVYVRNGRVISIQY